MNAPATHTLLHEISSGRHAGTLSDDELVVAIEGLNQAYRSGTPLVTDHRYDEEFLAELARRLPGHTLLQRVEPESDEVFGDRRIKHPRPMLSTEKAYTRDEISAFLKRVTAAAEELGLVECEVELRATVKLDGLFGYYDGTVLVTRGDGMHGYDISRALQRGVRIMGDGIGCGELVVTQEYFNEHLSESFEHPRNFMVGAVSADTLDTMVSDALASGAARFVLYDALPCWAGTPRDFLEDLDTIVSTLKRDTSEYASDGIIIEAVDNRLREFLGNTSHHYRYMIAIKDRGATATSRVREIAWQTGRTGRVTPVIGIEPVRLSGATISNVTGHHAGMVRELGIGPGAMIEILRAGEVIPKVERVVTRTESVPIPERCPSCESELEWDNDKFLICPNTSGCQAQIENALRHFFSVLGSADLFGPATIAKICAAGYRSIEAIYRLNEALLRECGFGPGQAANLVRELDRSRTQEIEDWRLLAALGIRHLGRGDSRRLLQYVPLRSLGTVSAEMIEAIPGFGALTSAAIADSLQVRWVTLSYLLGLGFNLSETPLKGSSVSESRIADKRICFTGTMRRGTREAVEEQATRLGAVVQSAVNGKTDLLVVGEGPGASKLKKAHALGTACMTEDEYLAMISQAG